MGDELKPVEPGVLKKAFNAVGDAVWNVVEKMQGKESADATALAIDAYSEGRFKEGAKFANEANKKAAENLAVTLVGRDAIDAGARSLAAYANGEIGGGAILANESNAKAMQHFVANAKAAVLGGEDVISHDGAPTTPTAASPKRTSKSAGLE